MNGFRLGSKTKVTIEVNDSGETISLDFGDPTLLEKAQNAMLKINELETKYQSLNDYLLNDIETDDILSDEAIYHGKELTNYYLEGRQIMDDFLGQDACYKVFGNDNYYLMFADLFDELQPYFDEANLKFKNQLKDTRKKYANRATKATKKVI